MAVELKLNEALSRKEFVIGVATSSFQIEGGSEHREPCIWDTFCKKPGAIKDASDGILACDHFQLWKQDIALVKSLGFDAYRFSVAWPRIIKANGQINQPGLEFYLQILNELELQGLSAYVTLYHWELPQFLEDKGGWLNRETAYAFAEYVSVIANAFGDKVKVYTTLNEPYCSAYLGYEVGIHAPGKVGKAFGKKAAHHLLLGHGLAMQSLKQLVPNIPCGLVLNFTPFYPADDTLDDQKAAELAHAHFNDWYLKPVIEGQYPDLLHDLPNEERPDVYDGDLAIIAQPMDYLGVNYYTRSLVRATKESEFELLSPADHMTVTSMNWEVYPKGLRDLLLRLNQEYELPPLLITENGMANDDVLIDGVVDDIERIQYLQDHMNEVAEAIAAGVDIRGFFVWSLMDNFEWAEGYLKRFGIVYVDFATQRRTPKKSALILKDWLNRRSESR